MSDFHVIRNRHLLIFNDYQQRKREIAAPVLRGQVKIEGVKALALAVGRNIQAGNGMLSNELIGRRVNFLV